MASSCGDTTTRETQDFKRRLLRQSSRAMQTPEHSKQIEVAVTDDCVRHERARRLAEAFDSPMEAVYQGSKVQEIHKVRRDRAIDQSARLLVTIGDHDGIGRIGSTSGSSGISPSSSSSSSGLSTVSTYQGFTPWSCTGYDDSGPCPACFEAACFFQRQHCQLAQLGDSDLSTASLSPTVDQSSPFRWEDYDDIEP